MHWILSTPNDFSLKRFLRRSAALILPPFHVRYNGDLDRVERLNSGRTVRFSISQATSGVQIRVEERLRSEEREELSRKTWRMLRLGEEFHAFHRLVEENAPHLVSLLLAEGARFLRGATLLEDIVRAYLFAVTPTPLIAYRMSQLVEQLGDPWPNNPTRHAFPTALQLLRSPQMLEEIMGTEAGRDLRALIASYLAAEERLRSLERSNFSSVVVAAQFQVLPGVTDCALAMIMFSLGYYTYIPTDLCPWERWHRRPAPPEVDGKSIAEQCAPWQPWGGLIYLLWDWSRHPDREPEGVLNTRR